MGVGVGVGVDVGVGVGLGYVTICEIVGVNEEFTEMDVDNVELGVDTCWTNDEMDEFGIDVLIWTCPLITEIPVIEMEDAGIDNAAAMELI